jgi:polysaccharide pyruvyl transferase WcaK-like protein
MGTPCVGLVYAPKVRHFMELLDLEPFAVELSGLTADRLASTVLEMLGKEQETRQRVSARAAELKAAAERGYAVFAERYLSRSPPAEGTS